LLLAAFVPPIFEEGVVAVLDHMLGARTLELSGDDCPLAAEGLDEAEELDVLREGPVRFANVRVQIVDPLLTALLEGTEELALRLAKKLERNISPLIFMVHRSR
jgi:hypothetical protein